MKLNRKHIHALDIAINKVLEARDQAEHGANRQMLALNANRLRQLRILMIQSVVQPRFDFSDMFHVEYKENSNLIKGLRMLTGYAEADTS